MGRDVTVQVECLGVGAAVDKGGVRCPSCSEVLPEDLLRTEVLTCPKCKARLSMRRK